MAGYRKGEEPVMTDKEALTKLRKDYKKLNEKYNKLQAEHSEATTELLERELYHINNWLDVKKKAKEDAEFNSYIGVTVGVTAGTIVGFVAGAIWYAINGNKGK